MESKFTKGPWIDSCHFIKGPWVDGRHFIADSHNYTVDSENPECAWVHVGSKDKCVAIVVTVSEDDNELDANTRLIAAAPDMYDLLESIENDKGQIPDFMWDKIQGLLEKIRG